MADRGAIVNDGDWSFRESWLDYINDFKDNVYPVIFEPFGFDFQTAFLIFEQDKVFRQLRKVADNTSEPADDWKKE